MWLRQPEMPISGDRRHAAARRALQVALLDQVRFEHVFDRVTLLADGGSEVIDADRTARGSMSTGNSSRSTTATREYLGKWQGLDSQIVNAI